MSLSLLRCRQPLLVAFASLLSWMLLLAPACVAHDDVTDLLIRRVSGCNDVGASTFDCPLQATLTIELLAPPTPAVSFLTVLFTSPNHGRETAVARVDSTDATQRTFTLTIAPMGYSAHWTNTVLNVSVLLDRATETYSTPFAGVKFAYVPPPTLTSMTGCARSDATGTYGCVPDADVLTIRGSGLSWLGLGRNTAASLEDLKTGSNVPLTYVNDSCLLFPLARSYEKLVFPQHYTGDVLRFNFETYTYVYAPNGEGYFDSFETNALPISFIPLPPPTVTAINVWSCNDTSKYLNQPAYYDCLPGVSSMRLDGKYMYEVSVLVGGVPCVATRTTSTEYSCQLPLIDSYTPGEQYAVAVYNSAGTIAKEATIGFTAQPTFIQLAACSDHGESGYTASAYCQPGDQLTILGSRFPVGDKSVQVMFTSASWLTGAPSVSVSCLSASVQDSGTVVCTLPALNSSIAASFAGARCDVDISFNSGQVTTNQLFRGVYDFADAPVVTSVTASEGVCTATNSPVFLTECGSGAVLTISGRGFALGDNRYVQASSPTSNNAYYYINQCLISAYTDTQIVCTMPVVDIITAQDAVVAGHTYAWRVSIDHDGANRVANAFRVTYAAQQLGDDISLSSTGASAFQHQPALSTGATAGVAIAAVALVLATAAAVLFYVRRRRAAASDSPKSDTDAVWSSQHRSDDVKSSDVYDVEMPSSSRYFS